MSRYTLSSEALLDLDDIWGYIARDDVDAADRWIAKLLDACETLARNPHIGNGRPEISDRSIFIWAVGEYLIFYRIHTDDIEIVAVTQGARDLPTYLRKRS